MGEKSQTKENEISFFDRFGRGDEDRARKRAQLASEYEEFKKWENEKFQNRFAAKKSLSSTLTVKTSNETLAPIPILLPIDPAKQLEHSEPKKSDEGDYLRLGNRLDAKLEELTQKIESLTSSYKHEMHDLLIRGETTDPHRYESQLQDRLRALREAEDRLLSIEKEYKRVRDNDQTTTLADPFTSKPMIPRANLEVSESARSPMVFGRENNLEQNKLKFEAKQRYRQELEQQILEAQQKRKAEAALSKATKPDTPLVRPVSPLSKLSSDPTEASMLNAKTVIPPAPTLEEQEYFLAGKRDLLADNSQAPTQYKPLLPRIDSHSKVTSSDKLIVDQRGKPVSIKDQEAKKAQYAQDLRRQIEEAKLKKELQKKQDEEYDRKMEEEFRRYHAYNAQPHPANLEDNRAVGTHSIQSQPGDVVLVGNEDGGFARGGHGVFGSPLTTEQKMNLQKYKEDLAKQIEDKRRRQEEARRREEELELRETERVAAEQARMQREFEAEKARIRASQLENEDHAAAPRLDLERKQTVTKNYQLPRSQHQLRQKTQQRKPKPQKAGRPHSGNQKQSECDLLIGPDIAIHNLKRSSFCADNSRQSEKDHSVLQQLRDLRTQLDTEKMRIEEALRRHQTLDRYGLTSGKPHPRVVRRGETLFTGPYLFEPNCRWKYGIGTVREVSPFGMWAKNALHEDSLLRMDAKQMAFLNAQDNYLRELNDELDVMTKRELLNDAILERQNLLGADEPVGQRAAMEFLLDEPTKESKRPASPSQGSVDIDELNEKNQQRLKRLEAIQLLNDIDTDPEAVLQRFVTKHDAVFTRNTE
ncbi:hypothetical protein X801_05319 [Opisthorchis viverrini]|uniref:Uncharacterized protein n=1 Tax=Opisthorchis viverrini TaxID=6198 RepID=A0A1S8WWA1_OPIVI|nr:hypothetical protein X801_05319 [Opisthorchis viverrini]